LLTWIIHKNADGYIKQLITRNFQQFEKNILCLVFRFVLLIEIGIFYLVEARRSQSKPRRVNSPG